MDNPGQALEEEEYVDIFFEDQARRSKLSSQEAEPDLKDEKIAHEHREKGNGCFRAARYREAAVHYSECVLSAVSSDMLSCALANRSAALHHLQLYEDSLKDVVSALSAGYASERHHKLYLRRARCCLSLGRLEEAEDALIQCRTALDALAASDSVKARLSRAVEEVAAEMGRRRQTPAPAEPRPPARPALSSVNPQLDGASSDLLLRRSAGKGRYVVTSRPVKEGSLLFVEQPYACVLLPDRRLDHCHHCITQTRALVPCARCRDVGFCGAQCRSLASGYHAAECGHARYLEQFGIGRAAVRLVLTACLGRVLRLRHRLLTGQLTALCDGERCGCMASGGDRYLAVLHLLRHLPETEEDAYHYSRAAATLAVFLSKKTSAFGDCPPSEPELRWLSALLLRHILQLVCNAHAPTSLLPLPTEGSLVQLTEERVATALYPSASMMNHACDPSIINSFWDGTLIVKAVKGLKKGKEVLHCYGPHYAHAGPEQRSEQLLQQYRFQCDCRHCTAPSLRQHLERVDSLRCLHCGDITLPTSENSLRRVCTVCGHTEDYTQQLSSLHTLEEEIERVSAGAAAASESRLQELRTRAECLLTPAHSTLARLDDATARFAAQRGDTEAALTSLRRNWTRTAARYGASSVEVGNHLLTLSDVLQSAPNDQGERNSARAAELASVCRRGLAIFTVHYGPWSAAYRDMERKLRHLDDTGAARR